MILLHSILALLHTWPGKIMAGVFGLGAALLAVAEANANNTLIIVAVITMTGTIFTGVVTLISARISASNRTGLAKLSEGIDGVAHELKAATAEGNLAKVDAALAKGKLQEREAEIARKGAAALAKGEAAPAPVIIENPPEKPANVKQAD